MAPVRPRLYLNHDADYDWLIALEFGRVDEGQPPGSWEGVTDALGFLHDPPEGPVVGFVVRGFSRFDPEGHDLPALWDGPRFDAPVLGLRDASSGEIILAARSLFGGRSSHNRRLFDAATSAERAEALPAWLACLQAGDSMAHFGLGYTHFELGRHREAYRHLRHYTEIAPGLAWAWCWFGRAAAAVGETAEARRAYERAIELDAADGDETDARDRLGELPGGAPG